MTASMGFKRLGIAIAAVVALSLGVVALSSFLISPELAGNAIKAQIRAATGHDPTIRGAVSVSMFPPDTVNFADVVLGDDRGKPALAAEGLTAHLRLVPLLVGRIEIADIALVRPRIALTFDARGRSNWAPMIDTLARTLNSDRSAMSFSEIHINAGTIFIEDVARNIAETLTKVELSLAWPSIAKTFAAIGQFVWHAEPLQASLAIGDFSSALAGEQSGLKFRLSGTPLKIAFDGTLSNRPTLKLDGMLAADATSLRETLMWMGGQPLPGGGFGRLALKARTNMVGGTIALSGLNIELDGNIAEGVLTYAHEGRGIIKGTLAVEDLNLTPYSSAFRLLAGNAREWNKMPMALDGLSGLDLDLRVSAARVTSGNAKLGRTAVAGNLRAGKLMLTIGESQAFGGLITGSLALAKSEHGGDFRSQMQFTNVDLENCLGELLGIRRIEGKGTVGFTVEGTGASIDALTRTLSGMVTLTAADGALAGLNVEQMLRRLQRRPLSGTGDLRSGRTPYDKLSVTMNIAHGIATLEDVQLEGTGVRLVLGGSASVPARDMDLRGSAWLLARANETDGAFELPFVVQGPWDDPILLPDPQSLIRRSGAAAPLLDAVRDRKARDAVRSAIDRLTAPASQRAAPATPGLPQ